MTIDVAAERQRIASALKAFSRPEGAEKLQAYLGSPVPVFGLRTAELVGVQGQFRKDHPDLSAREVNRLAAALWSGETFEEKAFAIGLLSRHAAILDEDSWRLADSWVDRATGWALSDGLASGPISAMVRSQTVKRFPEILRWTKAEHFWRRRASTYALNELVRAGELDRPFRLLGRLAYDPEFWVQRAVGTWLRECWKQDAPRTEAFLRAHIPGLPPVILTVATERAPRTLREALRKANRARRPEKGRKRRG